MNDYAIVNLVQGITHVHLKQTEMRTSPAKTHWRTGDILRACAPLYSDDQQVPLCASCHHCWTPPRDGQLLVFLQTMLSQSSTTLHHSCRSFGFEFRVYIQVRLGRTLTMMTSTYPLQRIITHYFTFQSCTLYLPTGSREFVKLRMIHHNSSKIHLGEAQR